MFKSSIIIFSLVASSLLIANQSFINPLGNAYKSTDNGGALSAIDAYKDGIGVVVLDNLSAGIQVNNTAMNTLVYTYGDAAKASGNTIVDQVLYGTTNPPAADLKLVGTLTVDGASCNDGLATTTGETWLAGVCQGGVNNNGVACNDGNIMTINDIYTNGVCAGTLTVNGATCNDNNAATYGDKWLNGVCSGVTNGTACNDGNALTYSDKYTNGVCAGITNGTPCNDGNSATTGETYLNGICQGGTIPTNSCNTGYSGIITYWIDCMSDSITTNELNKFTQLTEANYLNIYNSPRIENLDGLIGLTKVSYIQAQGAGITNVNGLINLKTINGIYFHNTSLLTDISGLSNITYIYGQIWFDNKNYTVKVSATSYLCQNYSTKIYFPDTGLTATAVTKNLICN